MVELNDEKSLLKTLKKSVKPELDKEIVIVCVGTDRSTGDSLGPLVGMFLKEAKLKNITVYGTVDYPVHGLTILETVEMIEEKHPNAYVLPIDAALSSHDKIGKIFVRNGPLAPGSAVGKDLPIIGTTCSIVGIVNVGGFQEYNVLQCTRLGEVMKQVRVIVSMIKQLDKFITNSKRNKMRKRLLMV